MQYRLGLMMMHVRADVWYICMYAYCMHAVIARRASSRGQSWLVCLAYVCPFYAVSLVHVFFALYNFLPLNAYKPPNVYKCMLVDLGLHLGSMHRGALAYEIAIVHAQPHFPALSTGMCFCFRIKKQAGENSHSQP